MRGNFVDIPTDCPQRDERLGWTGDIQVFAPTAAFLYDVLRDADSAGCATSPPSSCPTGPCRGTCRSSRRDRCGPRSARGRVGRCRGADPVDAVRALRRRGHPRGPVRQRAARGSTCIDRLAGDDHLWDDRLPARRLARPERAAARPGGRARPTGTSSPPPTSPRRPGTSRASAEVLGSTTDAERYADLADEVRDGVRRGVRAAPTAGMASDAQTAYSLAIAFDLIPTSADGTRAGRAPGRARGRGRQPHRHRLRRHAAGHRRPHDAGRAGRRLRPAARAGVPVVALPGDHGRDHDLGALGQHAARRHRQPRHDDLVQPLRARRGRGLAAPRGRGPRPCRAGLPPDPLRPAARWRPHLGDRARTRRRTVARRSRGASMATSSSSTSSCRPAPRRPSTCRAATPVEVGSGAHTFTAALTLLEVDPASRCSGCGSARAVVGFCALLHRDERVRSELRRRLAARLPEPQSRRRTTLPGGSRTGCPTAITRDSASCTTVPMPLEMLLIANT